LVNSAPVEQQLGVGADGYGILVAASGVGGMAAGVSCARLARRRRVAAVTTVSCALSTVGLLLYAGTSLLAVALAIAVLTGMGIVVADVVIDVAITRAARGDVLGRIFGALEGVQVAGIVLGAVTAPALTSILGVRLALVLFGTATTV
jgi:MFS family permease